MAGSHVALSKDPKPMSLRVLEFGAAGSDGTAAAYCGRLFALWGAEVVRVDAPASGRVPAPRDRALDLFLHPNKRRVGVDYTTGDGRALLERFARACDVVITDVPLPVLTSLRWQDFALRNEVVSVSITPFGLSGPYRDWQATDATLLALGGYTFLMGDPGRPPLTLPGHYVSYQAGQFGYIAARAALRGANGRVEPQQIEVSKLETVAALSQFTTVMWTYRQQIRSRHGNGWENIHPISLYPCRDGWFAVNVVPGFWKPFTDMIARPDLLDDPRFATNEARMAHKDALDDIIVAALGHHTANEIVELGQRRYRVPTGALKRMSDLLDDPHLAERMFWQPLEVSAGAPLDIAASPFRYAGEPAPSQRVLPAEAAEALAARMAAKEGAR
jgi:crotonobetainyl-CoA:carnitine CoA-transferase CaiB-like acyl-CoA transferase